MRIPQKLGVVMIWRSLQDIVGMGVETLKFSQLQYILIKYVRITCAASHLQSQWLLHTSFHCNHLHLVPGHLQCQRGHHHYIVSWIFIARVCLYACTYVFYVYIQLYTYISVKSQKMSIEFALESARPSRRIHPSLSARPFPRAMQQLRSSDLRISGGCHLRTPSQRCDMLGIWTRKP